MDDSISDVHRKQLNSSFGFFLYSSIPFKQVLLTVILLNCSPDIFEKTAKETCSPVINLLYENDCIDLVISSGSSASDPIKSQTYNTYYSSKLSPVGTFLNQESSMNGVKVSGKLIFLPEYGQVSFRIKGRLNHFFDSKSFSNPLEFYSSGKKKPETKHLKVLLNGVEIESKHPLFSDSPENFLVLKNEGGPVYIWEPVLFDLNYAQKKRKDQKQKNIIFIVIDSLRFDAIGENGAPQGTSPFLDEFSRTASVFKNHFVNSNWTRPSTMIFFTGLYPSKTFINIWDYPVFPEEKLAFYNSNILPLPGFLGKTGYEPVMIGNNPFLTDHRYLGVDTGFEKVFDFAFVDNDTEPITREVFRFLKSRRDERPLFLFLNYNDPHRPYTPPEEFLNRVHLPEGADQRKKNYLGEVAYVDNELGKLFQFLKQNNIFDDSLIIITSDHGEIMNPSHAHSRFTGIYTLFGHGQGLYDEEIHVPLLLKLPGQTEKKVINTTTRSIDLMPTIVDAIQSDLPFVMDGKSLIPLINGNEKSDRDYFGEGRGVVGIRQGNYKLLHKTYRYHKPGFNWDGTVSEEPFFLFDFKNDPDENKPVEDINKLSQTKELLNSLMAAPSSSSYFIRFTVPAGQQKRYFFASVTSRQGKPVTLNDKNEKISIDGVAYSPHGLQLKKEVPSGGTFEFSFSIYPDVSAPEIQFSIDGKPVTKGNYGVGGMDIFPGNCNPGSKDCSEIYTAKNKKPDLPKELRIQFWKSGSNLNYNEKDALLEKDAMNILRKQGYVK
ncbi:MAG: sulfatase [Leptospira sp.]|nr:sulfatase [Leptospira sp.]